jgi:hypothetical protein
MDCRYIGPPGWQQNATILSGLQFGLLLAADLLTCSPQRPYMPPGKNAWRSSE